jgi:hypothetical protein
VCHCDRMRISDCFRDALSENVPKTIPVYFAVFSNRIYFC